jgi:hypothetical protein
MQGKKHKILENGDSKFLPKVGAIQIQAVSKLKSKTRPEFDGLNLNHNCIYVINKYVCVYLEFGRF